MITNRLLRFLQEQMKKDPEKYKKFHDDYAIFLKEGILSISDQIQKVIRFILLNFVLKKKYVLVNF